MSAPKLLLIEDDPSDAMLLLRHLGALGFEAEHCYTLGGGLHRLTEGGIDLVLLDLRLPPFSRLESLSQMKAESPHVPIIVLSGYADRDAIAGALQAGASDYFVKDGLDVNRLAAAILRVVANRSQASGTSS